MLADVCKQERALVLLASLAFRSKWLLCSYHCTDLSRTYLAHHELESAVIIMIIIVSLHAVLQYTTVVCACYWQGNCSDLCPSNSSSNGFVMLLLGGEEEHYRLWPVNTSDGCCVQGLVQQRGRFCSSQHLRIDELMQFVNQQRLKRKQVNLRHLIDA